MHPECRKRSRSGHGVDNEHSSDARATNVTVTNVGEQQLGQMLESKITTAGGQPNKHPFPHIEGEHMWACHTPKQSDRSFATRSRTFVFRVVTSSVVSDQVNGAPVEQMQLWN